jgi:eukaryotic-like serine/threonine-protein kinase
MIISAGTRLGPYEVVAPIGAGGMGQVYRARDTRLERSVAIKVLPTEFAENTQLKLRFEREAKTISQLSHPNICALYDVGDGYLVMELLEGETLADRIAKGALPLDQVIRIGTEIANALDRAHKGGIVHRDLKPGNVMLTKSGAKLLDFGLAKDAALPDSSVLSSQLGMTVQKPLTEEGTLLGTFQYMAPEQLEGGEADARTDIFALGALLYEMATGKRAFEGKSRASLIASILAAEPKPISGVQPMTPRAFDRVVRKCLEKDPDDRWQSAHDIATELQWVLEPTGPQLQLRATRPWLAWTIAVLAVIALGAMFWRQTMAQRNAPVLRMTILPPDKATFEFLNFAAPPAISPDGTRVVFGAVEPGKTRTLWVRSLDSFVPQQIAGTEGAMFPFWSSDGRFIGFFTDNALKKVEIGGGAPVVICSVIDGRGASWSPDGSTILFAGRYTPIYRVSSGGGSPVQITKLGERESTHRWPEFLPDGRHFLYLGALNGNDDPSNAIYVGAIDGTASKVLTTNADDPHYLNGCLIFVRDRVLTAQHFDAKKLTATGDAIPLKEQQIEVTPLMSRSVIAISAAGTLVYEPGSTLTASQLMWFDRSGKALATVGESAPYSGVVIAPDEKAVLASLSASAGPQRNVWSIDLVRGIKSRVTFNAIDTNPIWSPDGRRMIYTTFSGSRFRFVMRDVTTAAEETLLEDESVGVPAVTSWSSDGQRILYSSGGRTTRSDIGWMSLTDRKPHVYLATDFVETSARFSPDGKWVAYQSNETGKVEMYIAPFPPTGAKWQVTTGGGVVPRWRSDGKELFFALPTVPAATVMAVPVNLGVTPQIGRAVKLFDFQVAVPSSNMYDVSRDGNRFLVNASTTAAAGPAPLSVVQHFDAELRAAFHHDE